MEQARNFLFIAYLLRRSGQKLDVCYHGCRKIVIPDYRTPTYIRGMIEFEGALIPVVDPDLFYLNNPTSVSNASCILIVEHIHKCRSRRTGVIIEDFEEVMNLAAGCYCGRTSKRLSFNMRFVLEMSDNAIADELLSNTHTAFDLSERQKQADKDFVDFNRIASGSTQRSASQSSRISEGRNERQAAPRMPFGRLSRAHAT